MLFRRWLVDRLRNAENGNPESQTASGRAPFAQDDRAFMVDSLDRLVETDYVGTGSSESVVLDRVGNREVHVSRDNEQTAYTLANACNEYAQVGGQPVAYDAAGNLIQDEDGREYVYDEQNRLIEIQAADDTVLAQYAYDALGRRVLFDDPVTDRTVRYYFDGPSVIEERNANEARTRFHIRGAQYLDEHVATYEDEPGEYRFYLLNDLYTVMGLGDDQGNVVEAYQYGAYGLSHIDGSSGCQPGDLDGDSVIDMADAALLVGVLLTGEGSPGELCAADLNGDGLADGQDVQPFIDCLLDANCPPPAGGGPSESGGPFALHGSIVDLLDPDENGAPRLMLQYNRARYYDIRHGRWLQRDPSGYVDGSNLYEAFSSNPTSYIDPQGRSSKLASGYNNGDEVFYQRGGWPFGYTNQFSVGKYYYANGRKFIVYDDPDFTTRLAYVLPFEQVLQWSKQVAEDTDYLDFVQRHGTRLDLRTGELIKRTVEDEIWTSLQDLLDQRIAIFHQFVRSGEHLLTGPAYTLITGEDPISEQTVPGRFRTLAGVFTALDFAPFARPALSFVHPRLASLGTSALARLERFQQRALTYLFDAQPGEFVLGSGLSPGMPPPGGPLSLRIAPYGELAQDASVLGQAHHLNQAAAFSDVIPYNEGLSIKLRGNILTQPGSPHNLAHVYLEDKFWQPFRDAGVAPTNLQYTRAMQQSLRISGLPEAHVQQAVRAAIRERVGFGLLGGNPVPKVPRPIPNLPR